MRKLWKKLKQKINNNLLIVIVALVLLLLNVKKTSYSSGNKKGFTITIFNLPLLQVDFKNGKIISFLLLGCGFYQLGEIKRKFIFNKEVGNNELDILDNRG